MAKKVEKANQVKKKAGKSFFGRYKWELVIFVFSVILYSNAVPNDYNMDDELVTINHRLTSKGISAIPEIFNSTYYKDDMGYAYEYRPMVLASFAVEHQVFDDKPLVSHFINVLLYGLCCVLLFRLLLTITAGFSVLVPVGIALLFVAHPAHTEVVSSIKNRDEILGLIFSFSACIAAFKAVKKSIWWIVLVPVLFAAALMSKMSVLPFALIIPLAVVLFTDAGFKKVTAISFLLGISAFFIFHGLLYDKLLMLMAMMAIAVLFFVFIHYSEVKDRIKFLLKMVLTEPRQFFLSQTDGQTGNSARVELKGFFNNVIFDFKEYLSLQPMAITFAVTAVYLAGVFLGLPLVVAVSAPGFFVLLVLGNEKTRWWANVMFYTCLTVTLAKYPLAGSIYADLLTLCIVYQIFYGDRKLFIPAVIIYVFLCFLEPRMGFLGIGVLMLVTFRWKWTWPLAVVNLAGGLYSSFNELSKSGFLSALSFHSDNYSVFLGLLVVVSLLLQRGTRTLITTFQVMAVVILLTIKVFYVPLNPVNTKDMVKAQITEVGSKVNTNIIVQKVDRPINFVEQPVTAKSPVQLRLGTAFEILFIYLHKVVLPYPMSFYYGYRFIEPKNITDPVSLISIVLYAVIFLLSLYCLKRNKLIGFALMVYLISIASVSTFFEPIPGQIGERFLLIPSLGWSIVFVMVLSILFKVKTATNNISVGDLPKGAKYTFAAVLCLYSIITFSRNFDWKDYTTIASHDIAYVENSSQANNLMALNMMKKSYEITDPAAQKASRLEALSHFKKALEIYPQFYNVTYDIARVFNVLGQNDSSIIYFKRAMAIDSTNPNPALFIGQMLSEQNKFDEAVPYYRYVIAHNVLDYQAYDKLSYAYFRLNNYDSSIAVNRAAIRNLPLQTAPYVNIARVFIASKQIDSARAYLQNALNINPNDPVAQQVMQQTGPHN